jgi:DNA polymerase II
MMPDKSTPIGVPLSAQYRLLGAVNAILESMTEARGFIVSAWDERRGYGERVFATGRLEDGRSFAAVLASPGPAIFVPEGSSGAALALLGPAAALDAEDWRDMGGAHLARIRLPPGGLAAAERSLAAAGVAAAGVDRMRADEVLAARGIRGPVLIRGEERPGRRVDLVFVEPELRADDGAASRQVPLRWLALDIETDREGRVVAASLVEAARDPGGDGVTGTGGGAYSGEVLFLQGPGKAPGAAGIEVFPDETALLAALSGRIARRDPDVITGWNVLDFDFSIILARSAALGVVFDAGRSDEAASMLERSGRKAVLNIPGRAVLDAMRLVRGSGSRYEDLSLETVASEVLGEGKSVKSRDEEKVEELELLRSRSPDEFCAYCLRDSELVLRILAKTGLDGLTARRAALTGVSLDLAWTSIPAFERVYGSELRARRVAVPPKAERRVSGAAGGTVLEASAGLFPLVLVLDFRSLYPSIMRTFNVDPLAFARAEARSLRPRPSQIASDYERSATMSSQSDDIEAPNGARFDREPGVMPGLIAQYASEREKAIASGDEVAAFVYKILQNSFYGVLGAEGCRYARTEIAGAITSFGKKYLTMARDFFEERGLRVLYGDTDSVFVLSGKPEAAGYGELMAMGRAAAEELNEKIAQRVREEFGLDSLLRIRCEKVYAEFLIPRLKSETGEGGRGIGQGRGRSKGYAGLLLSADGGSTVEVKGMEAARSDFTPLARDFQVALLGLVFSGADESEMRNFCRVEEAALRRGERDGKLVFRKTLRRNADDYASETPQVRAARLMGWKSRRGRVEYLMTRSGAEPLGRSTGALLDYDFYVERQLLPIAASIADALGIDARSWFGSGQQAELDFGN